jgi:hypothetical protein
MQSTIFSTDNLFVAAYLQACGAKFQGLLTNRLPFCFVFSNDGGEAEEVFSQFEQNHPVPIKEYTTRLTELRNLVGDARYKATGRRSGRQAV